MAHGRDEPPMNAMRWPDSFRRSISEATHLAEWRVVSFGGSNACNNLPKHDQCALLANTAESYDYRVDLNLATIFLLISSDNYSATNNKLVWCRRYVKTRPFYRDFLHGLVILFKSFAEEYNLYYKTTGPTVELPLLSPTLCALNIFECLTQQNISYPPWWPHPWVAVIKNQL